MYKFVYCNYKKDLVTWLWRPTLSANLLVDISAKRSTGRKQIYNNGNRYVYRESANLLADMSNEYRPIVLTDTWPSGEQITQDPI